MKKRVLSIVVSLSLSLSLLTTLGTTRNAKANEYNISNPRITEDHYNVTWDCLYFGKYWQNDTNGDGVADQNDEKEPIKWRILSVDGDDAFLLADQTLDCQPYNQKHEEVTWELCTLRSWLNSDFYNEAFSSDEQSAIKPTDIPTDNEGKSNIQDKIYLLSENELSNIAYGFDDDIVNNEAFNSTNTLYTISNGGKTYDNNESGICLTRQLFDFQPSIYVVADLSVYYYVDDAEATIRPCLHLDLSSNLWKSAGIVIADQHNGTIAAPTPTLTPTPTPMSSYIPTPISTPTPIPTTAPTPPHVMPPILTPPPTNTPIPTVTTEPSHEPKIINTPKVITAPSKVEKLTVKNKKKKSVTLSWKKIKGVKGYQVQYATDTAFSKKRNKTSKKNKLVINKLKKKKTYSFRVRAYILYEKKKVYGRWSNTKKVKIKK